MWSTLAVVLGVGGVGAGLWLAATEDDLLDLSPRGVALMLFTAGALLTATLLTATGLASWRWTAVAAAAPTILAWGRFFWRAFPEIGVGEAMRDDLARRYGPRGQ
jgi:hypothetical protein